MTFLNKKIIVNLVSVFLFVLSLASPTYANPDYKAPEYIKTQEQFWEYSDQFDFTGDPEKLNQFLKANQDLLQSFYDGLVDIGFTLSFAIQTEEAVQGPQFSKDGKQYKQIYVPIRIKTYSEGDVPFGKQIMTRDFALVPKNIEPGQEKFAVHTFADAFNYLDEPAPFFYTLIDNWKEYYLIVSFTLPIDQDVKIMNLRVYDGSVFIDMNITK